MLGLTAKEVILVQPLLQLILTSSGNAPSWPIKYTKVHFSRQIVVSHVQSSTVLVLLFAKKAVRWDHIFAGVINKEVCNAVPSLYFSKEQLAV